jgi:hypothetical protein
VSVRLWFRAAVLVALVAASLSAAAGVAQADGLGRVCRTADVAGGYAELTASQHASCAMATATLRKARRAGWPRRVRVVSPTTGRAYTMRRTYRAGSLAAVDYGGRFQIEYSGSGFAVGFSAAGAEL